MKTGRFLLVVVFALVSSTAWGGTFYRLELVGGSVVFSENEPKLSGASLVFRQAPQGTLVSLRRIEVAKVEKIDSENRPPVDFGGVTVKRTVAAGPGGFAPKSSVNDPRSRSGAADSLSWSPKVSGYRGYPAGDDMPGNRVAFPVSRDDLLPGNYRPFPAGRGGQTSDPPMIEEGRGLPKAGSLAEPPKVLQLSDPPSGANPQVPTVSLVFSEKPQVDPNPSNLTTTSPKRQ